MTTELDIVNAMLEANGEAPVSNTSSTNPLAISAIAKLARGSRKFQARGWFFNSEVLTLSPNIAGEVIVPQNTLSVDPVSTTSLIVKRGTRLYDKKNNTFIIDKSVKCHIVLQLDIEDMPQTAADYLEAKMVREYYTVEDGDQSKINELKEIENEAFAYFHREHLSSEDVNIRRSYLGAQLMRHSGKPYRHGFEVE